MPDNKGIRRRDDDEARKKALAALQRLEKIADKRQAIGIGHNNPPADIEGPDLPEIQKSVAELKLELQQPKPVVAKIKQWAKPLRDALVAAGRWAAQKADKAVDAAMKPIGTGLGAYVLDQYVRASNTPRIPSDNRLAGDRSEDAVLPGGRRCQTRQKSAFNSPRATLSGHCQASLLPSRLLA